MNDSARQSNQPKRPNRLVSVLLLSGAILITDYLNHSPDIISLSSARGNNLITLGFNADGTEQMEQNPTATTMKQADVKRTTMAMTAYSNILVKMVRNDPT
jgi:hypothetical protein